MSENFSSAKISLATSEMHTMEIQHNFALALSDRRFVT